MNLKDSFTYLLERATKLKQEKLKDHQQSNNFDLSLSEEAAQVDFRELIDGIINNSINTQNPRFLNQLYGASTQEAWLGELLVSILNTSMATYEIAPLATMMEKELLAKMNEELEFENFEGLIVPGGSYANMLGIHCARYALSSKLKKSGLYHSKPMAIFVSEDAHYSTLKSLNLLGLGTNSLIKVKTDSKKRMCVQDLEKKILETQQNNTKALCVVSTAGTTVWGAFDPISETNKICRKYNIWHHVDAAWGGLALWSEHKGTLFREVSKIDSITLDFHKLMASTLTKGVFMTSHPDILRGANSGGGTEYIFHGERSIDIGTYAIQCGRKVDSLPLWLQWKIQGTQAFRNKISQLFELKNWCENKIKENDRLKLLHTPEFMNFCFQVIPQTEKYTTSDFNKKIRERLLERAQFMVNFSSNQEHGYFIRLVFNQWELDQSILEELFEEFLIIANEIE